MSELIEDNLHAINALCKDNDIAKLYLFGSYANGKATVNSDIDMMVEINSTEPLEYADNYFNLKFGLENLLNKEIDLIEFKSVVNPYLKMEFEKSKQLLYGQ